MFESELQPCFPRPITAVPQLTGALPFHSTTSYPFNLTGGEEIFERQGECSLNLWLQRYKLQSSNSIPLIQPQRQPGFDLYIRTYIYSYPTEWNVVGDNVDTLCHFDMFLPSFIFCTFLESLRSFSILKRLTKVSSQSRLRICWPHGCNTTLWSHESSAAGGDCKPESVF